MTLNSQLDERNEDLEASQRALTNLRREMRERDAALEDERRQHAAELEDQRRQHAAQLEAERKKHEVGVVVDVVVEVGVVCDVVAWLFALLF